MMTCSVKNIIRLWQSMKDYMPRVLYVMILDLLKSLCVISSIYDHPEDYKDLNTCTCKGCGSVHTVHERVTVKN